MVWWLHFSQWCWRASQNWWNYECIKVLSCFDLQCNIIWKASDNLILQQWQWFQAHCQYSKSINGLKTTTTHNYFLYSPVCMFKYITAPISNFPSVSDSRLLHSTVYQLVYVYCWVKFPYTCESCWSQLSYTDTPIPQHDPITFLEQMYFSSSATCFQLEQVSKCPRFVNWQKTVKISHCIWSKYRIRSKKTELQCFICHSLWKGLVK